MITLIGDGIDFLLTVMSRNFSGVMVLFWYTFIFELPRYGCSFFAVLFMKEAEDVAAEDLRPLGRVSILLVGHNEADAVEACVRNLWEQSLTPDEIVVVSDGSTDKMEKKLSELMRKGLIHRAHCTDLRAGKSAGVNLAMRLASGDILINVDCDCSFDRHALKRLVQTFEDREVGAATGNILVRNPSESLIASFQAIEYLISISLGRRVLAMINQVTCASGAFSAFRRTALEEVGGLDSGGGEDLDVTLRLRRAGWQIAYAGEAVCYTSVPASLAALTRQRFRWERDAVRLRYRKHINFLNPFSSQFRLKELFHELEFLFFNVFGAAVLPIYCIWLFANYGELAIVLLASVQAGLAVFDILFVLVAAHVTPKSPSLQLLPYVFGYSFFYGFFMRFMRLAAYLQEWLFDASYKDQYVPDKVHLVRG